MTYSRSECRLALAGLNETKFVQSWLRDNNKGLSLTSRWPSLLRRSPGAVAQVTSHPRLTFHQYFNALETYGYHVPEVDYP